ncbi:hypothetical protein I4U23_008819 [Adineta vaga]|nr:hypothetical protein I4U23_008819 [Adineta vaga]
MSMQISTSSNLSKYRSWEKVRACVVCGANAIGINFGVLSCAPCKSFFRRNGKKSNLLELACRLINPSSLSQETSDETNTKLTICSDVRHCTSCRLRQCLKVGMKIEFIRSDEENQYYRRIIEINRQRKRNLLQFRENQDHCQMISKVISSNTVLLEEKDWRLLSNIYNAYDNYCVKIYTTTREKIFNDNKNYSDEKLFYLQHHTAMRVNCVSSLSSFLSSIPLIQSLSHSNRSYLYQHNVLPLIMQNLHELDQTCFSLAWQITIDRTAAEYANGKSLSDECVSVRRKIALILINDPIVTRLWLLVLFFSTPLLCYYNPSLPKISLNNNIYLNQIQNSFVNLLWRYLVHRQEYFNAIRVFANLIRIYLHTQRVGYTLDQQRQTRQDLNQMNQLFNRILVFEDNQQ